VDGKNYFLPTFWKNRAKGCKVLKKIKYFWNFFFKNIFENRHKENGFFVK
jgi:hypothetical protein